MNELVEFLQARIAESEAIARKVLANNKEDLERGGLNPATFDSDPKHLVWATDGNFGQLAFYSQPEFVLAECEAKRRIIELHTPWGFEYSGGEGCTRCVSPDDYTTTRLPDTERFPCVTLRALAQPYRDHPDFKPEWVI